MYFLGKLRKIFRNLKKFRKFEKKFPPKVIELIKRGEKYLAEKLREFFDWVILKSPLFEVGVQ